METVQKQTIPIQATQHSTLEQWNKLACDFVLANMVMRTRNGLAPTKIFYKKIEAGLEALRSVNELKHRTITEGITKSIALLEDQIQTTPWYHFLLKMRLRSTLHGARVVEKIVLGTAPPAGYKIVRRKDVEGGQDHKQKTIK